MENTQKKFLLQDSNRLTEKLTVYFCPKEIVEIKEEAKKIGISASANLRLRYLESVSVKDSSQLFSSLASSFLGMKL